MLSLYPALRDQEGVVMMLDTAKLKNRKSTISLNAWKRCLKRVDSQVNITKVFAIVFSETKSIVIHNS